MSDPTLLVAHTVPPDVAADLREALDDDVPDLRTAATPDETRGLLPDAEGLVVGSFPEELLAGADSLRWVQALSAGVDGFDLDALRERDVALTNASGVHAEPIAEQVLGYVLTFERGLHRGARQQARGVWERYEGGELRGKTVGVVGVGAIGGRVAELASAFGTTVLGTKRDTSEVPDGVDELYPADEYEELLRRSDYLVLACPLTAETRGLLGSDEFRMMPRDAVLVNVARGEVVDEGALVRALQSRTIRGAALDVFAEEPLPPDSPLWELSNVVVTPHMAGSTPKKVERWREILAANYRALAADDLDAMVNRVV